MELWNPFIAHISEVLPRSFDWVVVQDGGFGARMLILHEPGASGNPIFLRDGIPLGTGHRWTDDPWIVSITGRSLETGGYGNDGWAGDNGAVLLNPAESDTSVAVVETRFFKGNHETYLRSISVRTPKAPWRFRLDFEELVDQKGYDYRVPDDPRILTANRLGESKYRSSRAALTRSLADGRMLELAYERIRKHKTGIPVDSLIHEEIWADNAALTWRDRTPLGSVRTSLFLSGSDVERSDGRKLESLREGTLVEIEGDSGRRIRARFDGWNVSDNCAGVTDWYSNAAAVDAKGQSAGFTLSAPAGFAGWRARGDIEGRWESRSGADPAGSVKLTRGLVGGELAVVAAVGGRAPRSDELLTPDRHGSPERTFVLLPNPDLDWESTTRFSGSWSRDLLGFATALSGSYRLLRDGIGWRVDLADPDRGRWENDVELDGWTMTLRLRRAWRMAGYASIDAHITRRGSDIAAGNPVGLPPDESAALRFLWEKHLFHEDGIFEIGYGLEYRGAMDDPWLPQTATELAAITRHDLTLGFRMVGTDLGLEFRNLTDESFRLSSGAMSDGREMRWRLEWSFSR